MAKLIKLKVLTVFLLTLFSINVFAQITLTASNFGVSGSKECISLIIPDLQNDFNPTGPDYFWDYSSLNSTTQDSLIYEPVSQTPFSYQFYFNNGFLYPDHLASYAVKANNIDQIEGFELTDRYEYLKKDDLTLQKVGFGATFNSLPLSVKYDTIEKIFSFPLNYQDKDSSRGYYLTTIPNLGTYGQTINRNYEVDGWGTLTTPFNTYDVLRVKTVLKQRDTLYFDQLGSGYEIAQPDEVIYQWFAQNYDLPVLQVSTQLGIMLEGWFLDDFNNNISEFKKPLIHLYPNPSYEKIHVSNAVFNNSYSARILNINGGFVKRVDNLAEINISDIASGYYFLHIKSQFRSKNLSFIKL